MSERELQVEAEGETVGEAKWSALRELERRLPGLDKTTVEFQVISEGERGLLGVGYSPARVVASVAGGPAAERAAGPRPDESEQATLVRELVTAIAAGIGVPCTVDVVDEEGGAITATCSGRELGMLIGKHGQTIDAIQYLVNAIVARAHGEERRQVVVDASGYRARRTAAIEALADRSAEHVLDTGERLELEPMTAVERKIVHVRLKDVAGIETESAGTEPNRSVVITPAG